MIGSLFSTFLFLPFGSLNDSSYESYKNYLFPAKSETKFEDIEWYSSLWAGIVKGQDLDKPVLLWCMNGHPLGCT